MRGIDKGYGVVSDRITICIPTYRRPSMLVHCLYSCLMQDYRPLEIDISDNSPNDDTRTLVESLTLPEGISLRYWRNSPSIGPVENQKKLFAAARGRRFVWMNDDDVLAPGAVSAMAASFDWAPDVIASYGIEQVINPAGEVLPDVSARWNAEHKQLPECTGLRRDLLVCAFWKQMPHVGFMVLTEAARKVGVRDRLEVGLAADTDFAIRLGQTYKGSAHVFIDRVTIQTRLEPSTLSRTSQDVCWKLYDIVSAIDNLSPEEARARDRLLRRIGPLALREHSLAYRRRAALRIMLSSSYWQGRGWIRMAYSAGLIAMPRLAYAMRSQVRNSLDWLPAAPAPALTTANPAATKSPASSQYQADCHVG
jgi:glycosyltransferase involved in cell wall biosynthesis